MKKTFLLKATACALCGLTVLGATALVITPKKEPQEQGYYPVAEEAGLPWGDNQ